jgi:N-sulfoglucosamine sulfohydrolase
MRVLAKTDPKIAARVELFDHRVPEEAYEVKYDPDALANLLHDPQHQAEVTAAEKALEDWMARTHDPLLEVFRKRDDAVFREAAIAKIEQDTAPRKKRVAAAKTAAAQPKPAPGAGEKAADLIQLEPPSVVARGEPATIKIKYHFPDELGVRPIQVTLKGGKNERIERKTIKASGTGEQEVVFDIPEQVPEDAVIFAGLVGDSIKDSLQHVQTKPIGVK